MKSILLGALLILFGLQTLYAQDVLVKKNGEEIKVKIEEVTVTDIKYKKYDNPNGPLFYISKSDVFQVKYQDGSKETFVEKQPQEPRKTSTTTRSGTNKQPDVNTEIIKLGGPRVGVTYIGPGTTRNSMERNFTASPTLSQFGWSFETRLFTTRQGASGTINLIPLVGGVEQGLFLPSITGLIGIRTSGGIDFGMGPNLSPSGAGLAFMAGTTVRFQGIELPLHIAAMPSREKGFVFSFLTGFNLPRRQ